MKAILIRKSAFGIGLIKVYPPVKNYGENEVLKPINKVKLSEMEALNVYNFF